MTGLIAIVPLFWIVLIFAFGVWRRVQSGRPLAPRVPAGATFGETRCSGRVLHGVLARLGGASNCLIVTVDRDRFGVCMPFPFSLLPMPWWGALDIDVPVSAIARVTAGRRMWQYVLRIDFADINRAPIELVVRDEVGLVAALGPRFAQSDAGRPLRSKSGARLSIRLARGFMCLWGTVFMIAAGAGVTSNLAMRTHGLSATATVVGFERRQALLRYRVHGIDYTMQSRFSGTWEMGQTETVFYLRDDPSKATEAFGLPIEALMMLLGLIVLIFGLFGARLIPGW